MDEEKVIPIEYIEYSDISPPVFYLLSRIARLW
jgi:hypothetical protein